LPQRLKLPCLFKSLVPRECCYPPSISSILNRLAESLPQRLKLPCLFKSLVPRECCYPPSISSILNRLAESLPQRLKFISILFYCQKKCRL